MPVSSPVSLSKIKAEFGGGNSFSEYIRNGAYVPTNGTTGNISTARAGLSMSSFLNAAKNTGAPAPSVWSAVNAYDEYWNGAGSAAASIYISNNGTVYTTAQNLGPSVVFTWLPAGQAASTYQYRTSIDGTIWSAWTTITTSHLIIGASAYGDGFYEDRYGDGRYVQLGSAGVVLGQSVYFYAEAFVAGRF